MSNQIAPESLHQQMMLRLIGDLDLLAASLPLAEHQRLMRHVRTSLHVIVRQARMDISIDIRNQITMMDLTPDTEYSSLLMLSNS